MEGSLRTPCIIRWPGRVPAGRASDEIVHITDMFTTMVRWGGCEIPVDRVIDGLDQGMFFLGEQENSNREGFPFWNGERLYGVKWRSWKGVMIGQRYMWDPMDTYPMPQLFNLITDPKERENVAIHHTWVFYHLGRILLDYFASTVEEPPIPAGAPLDFIPTRNER